jgi:uncharacterized OsmC-like protein
VENERFVATLALQDGYHFEVRLDDEPIVRLEVDEARPVGEDRGPNPARMLATAVGHCLGSSLLFCLRKARVPVDGLTVRVEGDLTRNERGRLRLGGLHVRLEPGLAPEERARAGRCLEVFQDYCIVTESVRRGLPVSVTVEPAQVASARPASC